MENNNINSTSTVIGWLQQLLGLVKKHSIWDFIKSFLLIFIAGTMMFVLTSPEKVISFYKEIEAEQHTEKVMERLENNSRVQQICDRLLYKFDARRVLVMENHNGTENSTGLPFFKSTCTFESLEDSVYPVSNQYQAVQLSLLPFASYLSENHYWTGKTEDMKGIDKSLCYRMLANGTENFAAISIQGKNNTIGFIFLSYNDDEQDFLEMKKEMEKASIELAVLLEIRKEK